MSSHDGFVLIEQVEDDGDSRASLYLWIVAVAAFFTVAALAIFVYGKDITSMSQIDMSTDKKITIPSSGTAAAEPKPEEKKLPAVTVLNQLDLSDLDVNTIIPLMLLAKDGKQVIGIVDKTATIRPLYAFPKKREDGSVIVPEPINDEPAIFLSGVGGYGFSVLDLFGNDLSPDRLYWKEGDTIAQFIKYLGKDWLMYGTQPTLTDGIDASKIVLTDFERQIRDTVPLPRQSGDVSTLRPIGWSRDRQAFYVAEIAPPKTRSTAALWRVDRQTSSPALVQGLQGVGYESFRVNPYAEIAAGVVTGSLGSQLMVYDVRAGTAGFVADIVGEVTDILISADGNVITYEEHIGQDRRVIVYDRERATAYALPESYELLGMSYAGNTLLVREWFGERVTDARVMFVAVGTGEKTPVSVDASLEIVEPLACAYPLGIVCWYSK